MRAALAIALLMLAPSVLAASASDAGALALPLLGKAEPTLILAQRAIDRSWGPSDDSVYVELEIPQWRSEGAGVALSAAIPGAGQYYAGDKRRALWFVLAEVAGWTTREVYRHRGDQLRKQAVSYAGSPNDSTSAWSFDRWSDASNEDPASLEHLYRSDPEAFYELIASDSRYLSGWDHNPGVSREVFSELRRHSDDRLRNARFTAAGLWINHLASAVDALRAVRNRNIPLRQNLDLHLKTGWRQSGPRLTAILEARF